VHGEAVTIDLAGDRVDQKRAMSSLTILDDRMFFDDQPCSASFGRVDTQLRLAGLPAVLANCQRAMPAP